MNIDQKRTIHWSASPAPVGGADAATWLTIDLMD